VPAVRGIRGYAFASHLFLPLDQAEPAQRDPRAIAEISRRRGPNLAPSAFMMEQTQTGHRATVTIPNSLGLHLRPASQLVKIASKYEKCDVFLTKDGQSINAKSIMGVIMLAAEQGSELILEANGEGSEEAIRELVALIESGFGET